MDGFTSWFVPLRLEAEDVLMENENPSSPTVCRPIKFQFKKETSELTIQEKRFWRPH